MSTPSPSDVGRLIHLGIGNFARAHTLHSTDVAGGWSVVAFTGRSAAMADALNAQGGRYGLIVRGPEGDEVSLVDVIDEVFPASDVDALVRLLADPFTAVVTLTITEKGYAAGSDPATSAPARIALGLKARREAGVTEPFSEWVIEDRFRGRRPEWEKDGVQFTDDIEVHERRKLRLLNGAHTLMAYAGQVAGVERVDEAIAHREVRALVEQLWAEARATLPLPAAELDAYTAALEERFRNPRLADQLVRIAADGSVKLPVRALPVIAELGGPDKAPGEVAAVAAWTAWVTDRVRAGGEIKDPKAEQIAAATALQDDTERVTALLALLDVPAEDPLVTAVLAEEKRLPRP